LFVRQFNRQMQCAGMGCTMREVILESHFADDIYYIEDISEQPCIPKERIDELDSLCHPLSFQRRCKGNNAGED